MVIGLALLSAFVFGAGVVLQQRAAMEVPAALAAHPSLLTRLVRRPIWLLGLGADVLGFGLQALALHRGSLVLVQPLITTSLLFTLVLTAAVTHERISASDWMAVLVVLGGLAVFIIAAAPRAESQAVADREGWLLCTGVVTAVMVFAVLVGLRLSGPGRAAVFGLAAGVADAFMAVLAKAFAGSFDHGVVAVLGTWTPYALVAGGIVAILLISTAYQAGYPTVSLPVITITDPLVGSLIGITLFNEHLRLRGVRGTAGLLALAAMGGGLIALGHNRRLAEEVSGQLQTGQPTDPTMAGPT